MLPTVKDEIFHQIDRLDSNQQRKVLDFARSLDLPQGTPGRELLKFAGSIDQHDLDAISEAIIEACENVEPNGW